LAAGVVADGAECIRDHGDRLHSWGLSLDNCGFRLRFRSANAAAILFQ
jgi:hypothetical protein